MEKEVNTLYHYCSLETFYNIIKNKSIWLSDVSKSNDSKELEWAIGQCKKVIIHYFLKYIDRLQKNNDFLQAEFVDFKKITDKLESIKINQVLKAWVFCLSEKEDNLGQWRGYADDGKGISIGLNKDYFVAQTPPAYLMKNNLYYMFDKIKYGDLNLKSLLTSSEEELLTSCNYKELEKCYEKILNEAIRVAPFYKSNDFLDEKEWRIAFIAYTNSLMNGIIPSINHIDNQKEWLNTIKFDFTSKNNTLVSHIEAEVNNLNRAISSIIIGPKSNLSILDVKLFLISNGLLRSTDDDSIKIRLSSITYK